jgi:hypothetical protein
MSHLIDPDQSLINLEVSSCINQGLANLLHTRPNRTIFSFTGHLVSVTATQLSCCRREGAMWIDRCGWVTVCWLLIQIQQYFSRLLIYFITLWSINHYLMSLWAKAIWFADLSGKLGHLVSGCFILAVFGSLFPLEIRMVKWRSYLLPKW